MNNQNQTTIPLNNPPAIKVKKINPDGFKVRHILMASVLAPLLLWVLASVLPTTNSLPVEDPTKIYLDAVNQWEVSHNSILQEEADLKYDKCLNEKEGAEKKLRANAMNAALYPASPEDIANWAYKRDSLQCNKQLVFRQGTPVKPQSGRIMASITSAPLIHTKSEVVKAAELQSDVKTERKKEDLGKWRITRYYTPVKGQKRYFGGSYASDFYVNCSGDCLVTASGYTLKAEDAYKVMACPKTMPFGTKLWIENIGDVICEDRGGAIKGKRLDVWSGIGDTGLDNLYNRPETSGYLQVYKIL